VRTARLFFGRSFQRMSKRIDSAETLRAEFRATRALAGAEPAIASLTQRLQEQPASTWLACAQDIAQLAYEPAAIAWLHAAITHWPLTIELRYWMAFALWSRGEVAAAEDQLHELLGVQPEHLDALRLLATMLRSNGRFSAAARCMSDWWRHQPHTAGNTLLCVDFIRHCQRHALAATVCDEALQAGIADSAIYAQTGLLALELGRFDMARKHLLTALDRGVDLNTWFVPAALSYAQRYTTADHPDFVLFEKCARDSALTPKAQTTAMFALAKACDDVGQAERAAKLWREANRQALALKPWSVDRYRSEVAAALASSPTDIRLPAGKAIPIFIVGLPRSGTTLAAVSLGRHPDVRDRGELPHLGFIAQRLAAGGHRQDPNALREAANLYYTHLQQDDAPARWYIDKTPVNFLRLDLIATLFPQAQVIFCRRNRRDTALSLYAQFFANSDGDFAYDFEDIAAFATGHDQLMEHWKRALPLSIHTLDYEALAQHPARTIAELRERIGIPAHDDVSVPAAQNAVIGSSSLWQASQPVYTSSIGKWRAYAAYLPELEALFADVTM
jgi:tetratricopeptide (TPR) repeat protein